MLQFFLVDFRAIAVGAFRQELFIVYGWVIQGIEQVFEVVKADAADLVFLLGGKGH